MRNQCAGCWIWRIAYRNWKISYPQTIMPKDKSDVDLALEIRDDQVNTEAIMWAIRDAILLRREDATARGIDFDALAAGTFQRPHAHRFEPALYDSLFNMSALKDKAQVGMYLTESPLPIVGPLVQKVRRALHAVVLFYVNMSAERQIAFNAAVSKTTMGIVRALDREAGQQAEIEALRAEVRQLSERIAAIERTQQPGERVEQREE